jgi:hypothetical protein
MLALLICGAITGGGLILWLAAKGYIDLKFWIGVCGFKQRFGLPCPGCGWTHAAQAFLTGHPIEAFLIQPAAALFCVAAILTGIFALLIAVFRINFYFLKRLVQAIGIKILIFCMIAVILAGWLVTLIRTIRQQNGM